MIQCFLPFLTYLMLFKMCLFCFFQLVLNYTGVKNYLFGFLKDFTTLFWNDHATLEFCVLFIQSWSLIEKNRNQH